MGQAPAPDAPGDLHRRRLREPRPARRQASRQRAGTGRAGGVRRPPADRGQPGRDPRHRQAGQGTAPVPGARRVPGQRRHAVRPRQQGHRLERIEEGAGLVQDAQRVPSVPDLLGRRRGVPEQQHLHQLRLQRLQGLRHLHLAVQPGHGQADEAPAPQGLGDRLDHRRQLVRLLLLRGRRPGGEGQHLPRQHRLRHRPARPFAPPDHRRQHRPRDQEEARHHRLAGSQRQLHLQQPQLREQAFRDRPRP